MLVSGIDTFGGILGCLFGIMSRASNGENLDIHLSSLAIRSADHVTAMLMLLISRRDVLRQSARHEYELARGEQDPELVRQPTLYSSGCFISSIKQLSSFYDYTGQPNDSVW